MPGLNFGLKGAHTGYTFDLEGQHVPVDSSTKPERVFAHFGFKPGQAKISNTGSCMVITSVTTSLKIILKIHGDPVITDIVDHAKLQLDCPGIYGEPAKLLKALFPYMVSRR